MLNICRLVSELKTQKAKNIDSKNRLEVALKDVRRLNKKIGELEQHARMREGANSGTIQRLELPTAESNRAGVAEKISQQQEEIEQLKQDLEAAKVHQRKTIDQVSMPAPPLPILLAVCIHSETHNRERQQ